MEDLLRALRSIATEADREAKAIGSSARRGDQSKADTFRYIRDTALAAIDEYDPTPWCSACGATRESKCRCGRRADND